VNTGCYAFSQKIFPALEATKISERGEFELTDAINAIAANGKAGFVLHRGKCLDIGTIADLRKAAKG
jgi:bifunctional UDP-N-acetylglucosamine pyrophosphorylase/glucosamine-1-phosphate N-acetyltransferase